MIKSEKKLAHLMQIIFVAGGAFSGAGLPE